MPTDDAREPQRDEPLRDETMPKEPTAAAPDHGVYTAEAESARSAAELRAEGKRARAAHPFEELAEFHPVRRDPTEVLAAQNAARLPDLVGLRWRRMAASPFTFYRGSARLMAYDLAEQGATGVDAVICGDAHLGNFGLFASPERKLVFDLNDFDEAAPGPWEWDVRRLVTSVVLGAREAGYDEDAVNRLATSCARAYRRAMRRLSRRSALERYYAVVDDELIADQLHGDPRDAFERAARKARRRTSLQAVNRMTELDVDGVPRFVEEPPVLEHVHGVAADELRAVYRTYRASVRADIRQLIDRHRLVDGARRVVGVGSVGTRCYVLLLLDAADNPLILQVKEAVRSVVEEFAPQGALPVEGGDGPHIDATEPADPRGITGEGAQPHHGRRVVEHQHILQSVSDPFLGWTSARGHDFYVRQFRDMKGSINPAKLGPRGFEEYATGCGLLLARAHAQSGSVHWIAGYLGRQERFDQAIAAWSEAYADQAEADFRRFAASPPWTSAAA